MDGKVGRDWLGMTYSLDEGSVSGKITSVVSGF